MDRWLQDIRFAFRTLARQPSFAAIAILTIGLAIGANTAIYSVVRAVLLRDLPYENPSELVVVWSNLTARNRPKFPISPPDLLDLREQTTTFQGFAGITTFQQTLTGGDGPPEMVDGAGVTADFFDLLGVRPVVGRSFRPDEDDPFGADVTPQTAPPQTILISHSLWQRRFGGRQDIVGQTLMIQNNPAEIIGVLPPGFEIHFGAGSGLSKTADVWGTPRINVANWPARRNVIWRVIGRMRPDVSVEAARADVSRLSQRLVEQDELRKTAGYQLDVIPMIEDLTAQVRPIVWPLFGAVAFVLLIACANVSNLFLARASAREREFAVRTALGAARSRLVRQLLVESGAIAFAGAALGLFVAFGGIKLLLALRPENLPRLDTVGIDSSVLGFTLIAAIVSAFLFGLVPAMQASRPSFSHVLKDRGRSAMNRGQKLFRSSLVIVQVALSVVLLIGAGLMVRSFVAMQNVSLGYQPAGLLTFRLSLPNNAYPDPAKLVFFREFEEKLRAIPGVTQVSAAFPIPLLGVEASGRYGPPEALSDQSLYGQADYRVVQPRYFETMGTELVDGRLFDESDFRGDSTQGVIVDRKLARLLWPNKSAVGERMLIRFQTLDPVFVQVIGVVEHQRSDGIGAEGTETIYVTNHYAGTNGDLYWTIRTSLDANGLIPQVRAALGGMDANLPLADVRTMEDRVGAAMSSVRFALVLIGVFGGVALFLAAVGIYGVLSFTVRQRTGEIGVRMALGASARTILGMVVRQGMTLTTIGIVAGLVAGFWTTRLLGTLLVGVSANDPMTFAVMAALLMLAALGASYLPARRATLVDPAIALREEE
jgi:predicted permease